MRARLLLTALVLVGATACATVSRPASPAASAAGPPSFPAAAETIPAEDRLVVHALSRMAYGPRPGDVQRVRALGLPAYIEEQLDPRGPGPAVEAVLAELTTLRRSTPELLQEYPRPDPALLQRAQSGQMSPEAIREMIPPEKRPARIVAELQAARTVRAVLSPNQLEEIMVDFWLNHFSVFANKGEVRWFVTSFERDAIRPHVFGILVRTAHGAPGRKKVLVAIFQRGAGTGSAW